VPHMSRHINPVLIIRGVHSGRVGYITGTLLGRHGRIVVKFASGKWYICKRAWLREPSQLELPFRDGNNGRTDDVDVS